MLTICTNDLRRSETSVKFCRRGRYTTDLQIAWNQKLFFFVVTLTTDKRERPLSVFRAIREYGTVTVLASGADLLSAVDAPEDRAAFVVILVYEPDATTCCRRALDAVEWLARRHRRGAKFCRVRASAAGLSGKFRVAGVPCLLVYRWEICIEI